MKSKTKKVMIILSVAFAAAVITAAVVLLHGDLGQKKSNPVSKAPSSAVSSSEPEPEAYVPPVNFAELQAQNPDIYAWIEIPGTTVSYPILQREGDRAFYLNHSSTGAYSQKGSIYTEDYNSRDFSDPVTVIYGHHMRNGDMFGTLEKSYSNREFFDGHKDINIYMPNKAVKLKVFASVTYNDSHLLYNKDYSDPDVFNAFINSVKNDYSRGLIWDESADITPNDRIVILSTCTGNNPSARFLVLAKIADDENNS